MIRLTADEQRLFRNVARQFPEYLQVIERWHRDELDRLPYAVQANPGVLQGRAQVLTEMKDLLKSPDPV